MDINTVSALAANMSQSQTGDSVDMLVLRKAIHLQEQLALQMIEALPQLPVNPINLGQRVDVIV
jgi:hypothetical protein